MLPPALQRPLADRMRPRALDEVLGQSILAPGSPLRRQLDADRLTSCILWGPPGTGKTTIALLLAAASSAEFEPFSAVTGNVAGLRDVVERARRRLDDGRRTVLFVDEIHRFHKGQQDVLLPHVEQGLVTLIGATTENPSFALVGALLSRCAVHVVRPLGVDDGVTLIQRALGDPERGVGTLGLTLAEPVARRIAEASGGDARKLLGMVERIALHHRQRPLDAPPLDAQAVQEALGDPSLLYDRSGEEHYNCVSAWIKSMRGSAPDAALYWLARMVEGGEDPMFLARRLVVFAAEDVGLADPRALQIALACKDAVHFLGLPEGRYPLSEATLYLATAPKSSSTKAYFAAADAVRSHGALAVPAHLCNPATPLMRELGYGAGYANPHDFVGDHVPQAYLPDALAGARFYEPTPEGYERTIAERLAIWERRSEGGRPARKR